MPFATADRPAESVPDRKLAAFWKRIQWRQYFLALGVIAAISCAGILLPETYYLAMGPVYLLGVMLLSLRLGRGPVLAAGVSSAIVWEYLFIPPRFELRITNLQDERLFGTYFILALIVGELAARIRTHARQDRQHEQSEFLTRTLLDTVSHELRTPLAVITASLENFEESPPQIRAELADEMKTAAMRLNRLVRNLLDQTRLESGTLKPRIEWCDARDLANSAAEWAADALAGREFTIQVLEDMEPIRADYALTEHALSNLLLNAAVHTPQGAPVTLSAGIDPDGKRAFFSVADRGAGIPAELQKHLFQKFASIGGGRSGGLGLGLSIVHGFAAAQGGEIVFSNRSGGGSVFTIYLPHRTPQPAPLE